MMVITPILNLLLTKVTLVGSYDRINGCKVLLRMALSVKMLIGDCDFPNRHVVKLGLRVPHLSGPVAPEYVNAMGSPTASAKFPFFQSILLNFFIINNYKSVILSIYSFKTTFPQL